MGDMKTPDFDDLLAAFDIPDMVDPKAAIESGHHDDHDGEPKQPSVTATAETGAARPGQVSTCREETLVCKTCDVSVS